MTAAVEHECIDCRAEATSLTTRPRKIVTPEGEPKRCTTHLRRFKTRQRQQARGRHVERTYDISAKDAGDLLVFQNGRCWICGKATGASKLLAVDHDHADDWVRGRLCSTCNQFIGRQLGDDPAKAQRLIGYLSGDTPYRRMLAQRLVVDWHLNAGRPIGPFTISQVLQYGGSDFVAVRYSTDGAWCEINTTLTELQKYAVPKDPK
jgi:hypothetical protein